MTKFIVIFIVGIVVIGVVVARNFQLEQFRKNIKVGDIITFYVDNQRTSGEVVAMDENSVVVNSAYGTRRRFKSDIYPA